MTKKLKVFLVDDHQVLREGMRKLIDLEKDLEVCGEASDSQGALRLLPSCKPDLALIDLGLKGVGGLELIKTLKQRLPHLSILVMSMFEETIYAERALRAGAKGYVMKHEPSDTVIAALRRVAQGKTYLSPAMSERMLDKISAPEVAASPMDALSNRELEVFQLSGKGLKPAAIAEALHLSVKTIETYREQIKIKLKLDNAAELSQYAIAFARNQPQ
jgi:DNA-binding NarL/FixJ family response regulator